MEEDGFYINDRYIASFRLRAMDILCYETLDKKPYKKLYQIQAEFSDGNVSEPIWVKDYRKMQFSDYWENCIDIDLNVSNRKLLLKDLQNQISQKGCRKIIELNHTGLYRRNPVLYVYSKEVVVSNDITITYATTEDVPSLGIKVEKPEEDPHEIAKQFCQLLPSVTNILFLYRALSILKPVLTQNHIKVDTLLGVIGRRGTLKTTLSDLIIPNEGSLKIMTARRKEVENLLNKYQGGCVRLDDYKYANQSYMKNRMLDIFEMIARTSDAENTAMVVTTGEFIEGDFSMQDRMIQLYVDKTKNHYGGEILERLLYIQNRKMYLDMFWCDFAKKAYYNLDKVEEIIQREKTHLIRNESAYRIDRNIELLKMVYKIYFMLYEENQSLKMQFDKALEVLYKNQVKHMNLVRFSEAEKDWSRLVYEAWDKDLFPEVVSYLQEKQTVKEDGKLYLTVLSLKMGMKRLLYTEGNVKEIVNDLAEKQLLYRDNSNDYTVKRKGKRYYAINMYCLKNYVDFQKSTEMILPIIKRNH